MAITLGDAVVMLRADDSPLKETLDSAEKATKKAAEGINKAALAIGAAALAGVGLLAKGLWDAGQAAAAEEVGIVKLAAAVDASGASWNAVSGEIEAYITAAQKRTAFDDGEQRQSLTNLIATTGSYEQALALLPLAMDIARAKGMDLATASDLVGKVAMGNTSILTRYGIVLQEGATAQEALAELQSRFAGQAEAYGNTVAGKTELMKQQWGNLMETIGGFVLPILLQLFTALGNLAEAAIPMVSQAVAFLKENADIIIPVLVAMAATLTAILMPSLIALATTATAAGGTVIAAMLPILAPIAAVGAAAALLAIAWKNDWGGIQEKTQAVIDFIKPYVEQGIAFVQETIQSVLVAIREFWRTWGDDILAIVQTAFDLIKNLVETVLGVIKGLFDVWRSLIKGDWQGVWDALLGIVRTMMDGIKQHIDTILGAIRQMIGDFSLVDVGRALIQGLADGISAGAGVVADMIRNVVQGAIDAAKRLLGISSPSKVFETVGGQVGQGLANGIWGSLPKVVEAANAMVKVVWEAAQAKLQLQKEAADAAAVGKWKAARDKKDKDAKDTGLDEYDTKLTTTIPKPWVFDPYKDLWGDNKEPFIHAPDPFKDVKKIVAPTRGGGRGGGGGGGSGAGSGKGIIVDDFGEAARAVLATLALAPVTATTDDLMRQMEFEARLRGGAR